MREYRTPLRSAAVFWGLGADVGVGVRAVSHLEVAVTWPTDQYRNLHRKPVRPANARAPISCAAAILCVFLARCCRAVRDAPSEGSE